MGLVPTAKPPVIGQFANGRNATDDFLQLASSKGGTVFGWIDSDGHLQGTLANNGVLSLNGLTGAIVLAAGTNVTLVPTGNTLTINAIQAPGGSNQSVQFNNSGSFGGDTNFLYNTSTATINLTGNITETGVLSVTGPATASTVPGTFTSTNNGPTNVQGAVLALVNSSGATTAYIVKGSDNSLIIRNDGAAIGVRGVFGFLSDGSVELLAGTNGAQVQMNTNAGAFPAGSVSWMLPLSGVGTARFNLGTGTAIAWNWDAGTGNTLQTLTHNEAYVFGSSTELLTLSTSGATTNTVGNLLPANAIIESVVVYITQTISGGGTPTVFAVGDSTTAARFISNGNALTAGTSAVGLNQMQGGISSNAAGPVQTTAATVRVTLDQTPAQGQIRITVFYKSFAAPTS